MVKPETAGYFTRAASFECRGFEPGLGWLMALARLTGGPHRERHLRQGLTFGALTQAVPDQVPTGRGAYAQLQAGQGMLPVISMPIVNRGRATERRIARTLSGFEKTCAKFPRVARFTDRKAGALSGGMKQKLGLACAMLRSPQLLLLDEPSVGVDPISRRELWRMVYTLIGEGVGVVWSTAYLDEAENCAEVIVLNLGHVLYQGNPKAAAYSAMYCAAWRRAGCNLPRKKLD
jgi:ATPase subunit of ABC transporter with duplicated ATPase domains